MSTLDIFEWRAFARLADLRNRAIEPERDPVTVQVGIGPVRKTWPATERQSAAARAYLASMQRAYDDYIRGRRPQEGA